MAFSPDFVARRFEDLTLYELQQIHITRALVFYSWTADYRA